MTTLRELGFTIKFQPDEESLGQVEGAFQKIKAMGTAALGGLAIIGTVKQIGAFITGCVDAASNAEQMQQKFNVVFGEMADEVNDWAKEYADSIGRSRNEIKTYLADQQNLLVGFGMTREEGANLSKEMTSLALDIASFTNIDEAYAVQNMSKALMGESECAKALGAVLNDTTREETMRAIGLDGTYESLSQVQKMEVNYQAILRQSKDAVGDCKRSMGSYESTLRQYNSRLKEIRGIIGQFFLPVYQKILSYINRLLTRFRDFLQRISNIAKRLGGSERVVRVFAMAIAGMLMVMNVVIVKRFAETILTLARNLKIAFTPLMKLFFGMLLLALAIDDFMAFMRGDNSVMGVMLQRAGVDCENFRQNLIKIWTNLTTALGAIWQGFSKRIILMLERLWSIFRAVFFGIGKIITFISPALAGLIDALANGDVNVEGWQIFGETLGELAAQILGIVVAGYTVYKTIQMITFAVNTAISVASGVSTVAKLLASPMGLVVIAIMAIIAIVIALIVYWDDLKAMWASFCDYVIGLWSGFVDSIISAFQTVIDFFTSLPTQAMQWGMDIIQGLIDGITSMAGGVSEAVSGVADKIKALIGFSEPEEGPLSDFHTYMPDMMNLMAEGITAGKATVDQAMKFVAGDMSNIVKANNVSPATTALISGYGATTRTITQNIEINNQFNGDTAGQQKASVAMDKAAEDSTGAMARALAFAG